MTAHQKISVSRLAQVCLGRGLRLAAQIKGGLNKPLAVHAKNVRSSVTTTANDIATGFFEISHSGFALLGLGVVFGFIMLMARQDLRDAGETQLYAWLQGRQAVVEEEYTEPNAIDRATATNPKDLPKQQAAVAYWLSKKYGVAPEPLSALVAEAFEIGQKAKLDPTLILAIMAIESGFNPFAQSRVGAQGLMQVMTTIHHDKYENFGGKLAAFDPVTNLRVGVKVLQECIARAGSIEGGLKYYVGAANLDSDNGYASKVLAEHSRLQSLVGGKSLMPARMVAVTDKAPDASTGQITDRITDRTIDRSPAKAVDAANDKAAHLPVSAPADKADKADKADRADKSVNTVKIPDGAGDKVALLSAS